MYKWASAFRYTRIQLLCTYVCHFGLLHVLDIHAFLVYCVYETNSIPIRVHVMFSIYTVDARARTALLAIWK